MLAMVLGGASCIWQDVRDFRAFGLDPDIIVACNDAAAHWPEHLTAACSLHADKLESWLRQRERAGFDEPEWCFVDAGKARGFGYDETEYRFDGQRDSGSSGLFAAKVALEDLRADRVVLCGIPMDGRAHFYGGGPWGGHRRHVAGWQQALPAIAGRARSMSGWTKEILGEPSPEWLLGAV